MRPPAIERMGYYPTNDPVVEIIKTYVKPPEERGRLFDPCAGEGRAGAALGKALNCEIWGVELSPERAEKAQQVMDRVYQAPWQACVLTDESISWLYLNPPYEFDRFDNQKRLEWDFLKTTTPKLMRGGLLTYIIPQKILGMTEVARLLARSYEAITVYRFLDGLYEKFKQVVVFAYKRKVYHVPTDKEVLSLQNLATTEMEPIEAALEPVYELLAAPTRGANGKPIVFKRTDWEPEEVVEATVEAGVQKTTEWLDLIHPTRGLAQLTQPVMPLKKGHIAMVMASGMMGTMMLRDDKGRPMLIKGRVVKVQEKVSKDTKEDVVTEVYRDRFVTTIAVLNAEGIQIIKNVPELAEFMRKHGDKIAAHVLETYRPLYNLDPNAKEIAVLDTLGRGRNPLPSQNEAGLLPTQRHAAAALARCIRKNSVANIQMEMGGGKTSIGSAVIELLEAYPALVICPPHLVPKWIRELEEVIPGCQARELHRIGRISGDPGDINDVRSFLEDYRHGKLGPKAVAVIAHTSAKIGPGWEPAIVKRKIKDPISGQVVEVCTCPSCGAPLTDDEGIMIQDPTELADKRRFCKSSIPGWQLDAEGRLKHDDLGNPIWGIRICNTPLFGFSGARRWALAEYIAKHEKGSFKLLIADEVHEFKGKSSDRGIAFHQLVTACPSTLTLTGTFFGGRSTSIFWILHRLNASVRRNFAFHDEKRWARLYGVLETTRRRIKSEDADVDGVFTGNRRYQNQAKEQPGVSPAIVNRLLDTTIFLTLKDLGLALPEYKEEVAALSMLDDQEQQYQQMDSSLKALAIQNNRYLSTWLQWSLARPNSAFRDEVVVMDELDQKGEIVRTVPYLELPAINPNGHKWLPKENWLASFCRTEKSLGRKVLVYVRQTGVRDIQDHLVLLLEENGLRVTVLGSHVDPRNREEWIAKRTDRLDVLICNPELVKTGLDLVQFSSVVFFEISYSLYTLLQALRRVWRLGQVKSVRAVFSIYSGTMEARALSLMGLKMKAAQLLYGDEVGGAIVPQEESDLLTELAREVLNGAALADLQTLFADEMRFTNSPLGCLTETSPLMVPVLPASQTWEEWLNQHPTGRVKPGRGRVSKQVVADQNGQLSIWSNLKKE